MVWAYLKLQNIRQSLEFTRGGTSLIQVIDTKGNVVKEFTSSFVNEAEVLRNYPIGYTIKESK